MNLKSIKYQTQIQKWTQIVQKRNQSGLRILDFCAQEGITKDAYYYWLRRVREAALESQTGIDVVDTKPRLVNIAPALPAEEPSPIQCDCLMMPVVLKIFIFNQVLLIYAAALYMVDMWSTM